MEFLWLVKLSLPGPCVDYVHLTESWRRIRGPGTGAGNWHCDNQLKVRSIYAYFDNLFICAFENIHHNHPISFTIPHRTVIRIWAILAGPCLICLLSSCVSKLFSGGVVQIWRRGRHSARWWEVSTRLGGDNCLSPCIGTFRLNLSLCDLHSEYISLLLALVTAVRHSLRLQDLLFPRIRCAEQAE